MKKLNSTDVRQVITKRIWSSGITYDYYKNNYSALGFVKSVKEQLIKNGKLSEKQMQGLNKVYKRYNKGSKNEIN